MRRLIEKLCCLLAGCLLMECANRSPHPVTTPDRAMSRAGEHTLSALWGRQLYTDPMSEPANWWRENRLEYPDAAEILRRMATMPTARWVNHLPTPAEAERETGIMTYLRRATAAGRLPVLVLYDIPGRDANGYSRGGAQNATDYRRFVETVDRMIGNAPAILIVEPDALAHLPGLPPVEATERISLLREAVTRLARPNRYIYLDVGHAGWLSVTTAVDLLRQCGIEAAQGFALNISNFRTVEETVPYAREIAGRLGGHKTAVIDTSRCGNGPAPDNAWCNPPGRALGPAPTTRTASPIDALLWVKRPWESDGDANGAPRAGDFYLTYALDLARNAGWR